MPAASSFRTARFRRKVICESASTWTACSRTSRRRSDVEAHLFGSAGAVEAGPTETATARADDEDDATGTEAEPDEEAIAAGRLAAAREERRGLAAAALQLDYHVDDNSQNCLDLIADSTARPILILPRGDGATAIGARQLGILTVGSIGEALDVLEKASTARSDPGLLAIIAEAVGWK